MPATGLIKPTRRRLSSARPLVCAALVAALVAALLTGCGAGDRTPSLKGLPLLSGVHIFTSQHVCDQGSNAYCAIEMVVTDSAYPSSADLQTAEQLLLKKHGWVKTNAPVGQERAADSPGDHLRVTYAAANLELEAIDLGWITRSHQITLSLSRQIFNHASALAVLLQVGTT
jgi:hypothetical protein